MCANKINMKTGGIYYRVTYLDPLMRYPVIKAFLCLGVNLSDDDMDGDVWYFQDVSDYYEYGSALEATEEGTPVVCLPADALYDDMLDIDRLHAALSAVNGRM